MSRIPFTILDYYEDTVWVLLVYCAMAELFLRQLCPQIPAYSRLQCMEGSSEASVWKPRGKVLPVFYVIHMGWPRCLESPADAQSALDTVCLKTNTHIKRTYFMDMRKRFKSLKCPWMMMMLGFFCVILKYVFTQLHTETTHAYQSRKNVHDFTHKQTHIQFTCTHVFCWEL